MENKQEGSNEADRGSLFAETQELAWHYTSLHALNAILSCGDGRMQLRLSHSDYLNDPLERKLVLNEYGRQYSELDRSLTADLEPLHENVGLLYSAAPFVTCFSLNRDNLLLWSLYAQERQGVAIGMRTRALITPNERPEDWEIRGEPVQYSESEIQTDVSSLIKQLRRIRVEDLVSTERRGGAPSIHEGAGRSDHSYTDLSEIVANYKSPGWKQEEEWRLIARMRSVPYVGSDDDLQQLRSEWRYTDDRTRPFVTLGFESSAVIQEIVVGPNGDMPVVQSLIASYGLSAIVSQSPTIVRPTRRLVR